MVDYIAAYLNVVTGVEATEVSAALSSKAVPYARGFDPSSRLKNWRRGRARVRTGTANANILFIQDSTGTGPGGAGTREKSVAGRLVELLNKAGLQAGGQNYFFDFGRGNNCVVDDTRATLGSWALTGVRLSSCGQSLSASATTATPATFTPGGSTDTLEIYFATNNTSYGSFRVNANGGADTTISTIGTANSIGKAVFTTTLGSNTFNLNWDSAGPVYIFGYSAYNSAIKQVSLLNLAKGGLYTAQVWTNQIAAFTPALTVIQMGINDWLLATTAPTYQSSLTGVVTAALVAGSDVLLVSPLMSGPGSTPAATIQPYLDACAAVAAANAVVFYDMNARWGNFAGANALGFYNADNVHGTDTGYYDEAEALAPLLLAA